MVDSSSKSFDESAERHQLALHKKKAAILTSRAALSEHAPHLVPETIAAVVLVAFKDGPGRALHSYDLRRHREDMDMARAAAAWWRATSADPLRRKASKGFTCSACSRRMAPEMDQVAPCQQCQACICAWCVNSGAGIFKCPACSIWQQETGHHQWGVPWDMPRPAASPPAAAAAVPSSALPRRMAAAVGPDGWLRLPPRHQRMHPVDVLVDGVLAALDGYVNVYPNVTGRGRRPGDKLTFTRVPLSNRFHTALMPMGPTPDSVYEQACTLEDVRAHLRPVRRLGKGAQDWGSAPDSPGRARGCTAQPSFSPPSLSRPLSA